MEIFSRSKEGSGTQAQRNFKIGESVGNINRRGRLMTGEDLILKEGDGFTINTEEKDVIFALLISYKINNNMPLDSEEQDFYDKHKSEG